MTENPSSLPRISPRQAWIVLVLCIVPYFIHPAGPSVWDANEAFYVETPREMLKSGNWLVPHFNGQPRLNKPPLSYWLVAPLYQWFGVNLLWERLLMSLLAAGSILVTFLIGRRLWSEAAPALLAAVIFSTTFRLFLLARRLLIDLLLLFLVLAALYFIVDWLQSGRRPAAVAASVCLGLGFLAKGPVVVLPLVVMVAYLAFYRQFRRALAWEWVLGGFLFLTIAGSWFAALGLTYGWEPVRSFLFTENVGRFLDTDFGPRRGYFYYVGVFLADSFPWSLIAPVALIGLFRDSRRQRQESNLYVFFLIWCLFYFIFFSLSLNKQEYYIAPLYASASLLIAGWAVSVKIPRALAWLESGSLLLAASLLLVAGFVLFPDTLFWLPPVALLTGAVLAWRGRLLGQGLALSAFLALSALIYLPALEAFRPVRPFAETINRIADAESLQDWQAGYFLFTAPSLRFYLDRNISELYEASAAVELMRSTEPVFLITNQAGFNALSKALPPQDLHVIESRPILRTTGREFWKALRTGQSDGLRNQLFLVTNRASVR